MINYRKSLKYYSIIHRTYLYLINYNTCQTQLKIIIIYSTSIFSYIYNCISRYTNYVYCVYGIQTSKIPTTNSFVLLI